MGENPSPLGEDFSLTISKSKSKQFDTDFDCDFDAQQAAGNYTLKEIKRVRGIV